MSMWPPGFLMFPALRLKSFLAHRRVKDVLSMPGAHGFQAWDGAEDAAQ